MPDIANNDPLGLEKYLAPPQPVSRRERVFQRADELGVPRDFVDRIVGQESSWTHTTKNGQILRSPKNAVGLFQVVPDNGQYRTIGGKRYNVYNEDENVDAGLSYLKEGLDAYRGDQRLASLYYFGGPGAAKRAARTGKIPNISDRVHGQGSTASQYVARATDGQSGRPPQQSDPLNLEKYLSSATTTAAPPASDAFRGGEEITLPSVSGGRIRGNIRGQSQPVMKIKAQAGDTLAKIAERFNFTPDEVAQLNPHMAPTEVAPATQPPVIPVSAQPPARDVPSASTIAARPAVSQISSRRPTTQARRLVLRQPEQPETFGVPFLGTVEVGKHTINRRGQTQAPPLSASATGTAQTPEQASASQGVQAAQSYRPSGMGEVRRTEQADIQAQKDYALEGQVRDALRQIKGREPTRTELVLELNATREAEARAAKFKQAGVIPEPSNEDLHRAIPEAYQMRAREKARSGEQISGYGDAMLQRMPPHMRSVARAGLNVAGSVAGTGAAVLALPAKIGDAYDWLVEKTVGIKPDTGPFQAQHQRLSELADVLQKTSAQDVQEQERSDSPPTFDEKLVEGGLTAYGEISTKFAVVHKLFGLAGVVPSSAVTMAVVNGLDHNNKDAQSIVTSVIRGALTGKALDSALTRFGTLKGSALTGAGFAVESYAENKDVARAVREGAVPALLGLSGGQPEREKADETAPRGLATIGEQLAAKRGENQSVQPSQPNVVDAAGVADTAGRVPVVDQPKTGRAVESQDVAQRGVTAEEQPQDIVDQQAAPGAPVDQPRHVDLQARYVPGTEKGGRFKKETAAQKSERLAQVSGTTPINVEAYRYGDAGDISFSSKNQDYAEDYARARGGKPEDVRPVQVSLTNPLIVELPDREFSSPAAEGRYIERAQAEGRDGVVFRNNDDEFYVSFKQPKETSLAQAGGQGVPAGHEITPRNEMAAPPEVVSPQVGQINAERGVAQRAPLEVPVENAQEGGVPVPSQVRAGEVTPTPEAVAKRRVEAAAERRPYEMTRREYVNDMEEFYRSRGEEWTVQHRLLAEREHQYLVEQADRAGEKIPDVVRDEYPRLAAKDYHFIQSQGQEKQAEEAKAVPPAVASSSNAAAPAQSVAPTQRKESPNEQIKTLGKRGFIPLEAVGQTPAASEIQDLTSRTRQEMERRVRAAKPQPESQPAPVSEPVERLETIAKRQGRAKAEQSEQKTTEAVARRLERRPRRRPAPDPERHGLADYVRLSGGVRPDRGGANAGELRRLSSKELGGRHIGLLNQNSQYSVEMMMRRAAQEGYLPDYQTGESYDRSAITPSEFVQMIEDDARGTQKRFSSANEIMQGDVSQLTPDEQAELDTESRYLSDLHVVKLLKEVEDGREDEGVREELYTLATNYGLPDEAVDSHLGYARETGLERQGVSQESVAANQGEADTSFDYGASPRSLGRLTPEERIGYEQSKRNVKEKLSGNRLTASDPYGLGLFADLAPDLIKISKYHVQNGYREFKAWSEKMIQELGEGVRPHLEKLYSLATREEVTSPKVEATRAERGARGLNPVERQAYQTMGESYEKGKAETESGVIDPRRLAEEVAKTPRPLTATETGALGFDRARLLNAHDAVITETEKALASKDTEKAAEGRVRLEQIERDLDNNDKALELAGREWSMAGQARKSMIRRDYSLTEMVRRYKAETGKEPTPEVRAQIEGQARRIKDLEAQLSELEERRSKEAAKKTIDRLALETRKARRVATKEVLRKEFDDLSAEFGRLAGRPNIGIDPKLAKIIAKMAKNRVEAGIVTVEGVVDDIHAAVKDYLDNKRAVRDAISGYGVTAEMSKDETARTLRDIKQQMRTISAIEDAQRGERPLKSGLQREPYSPRVKQMRERLASELKKQGIIVREPLPPKQGPKLSDVRKLPMEGPRLTDSRKEGPRDWLPDAKARLQERLVEYERRIREGDFSEPKKREAIVYDREGNQLKAKLEKAKNEYEDLKAKNKKKTIGDYLVRWKRFAVLTYPTTLGKLGVAATGRMIQTPIEEVTGGILSKIPGISGIAERAPREGRLNIKAEVEAVKQLWQSDSFRGMLDQIKGGRDMLDLLYGKKRGDTEFMNLPGRLHGAEKEIPKRAEFYRAFEKRLSFEARKGKDIADPELQMAVAMESYNDAMRAIFMQPNAVSDWFNRTMNDLARRGGASKMLSSAGRFIFPITRVPVNYVAEQTSLVPPIAAAKVVGKLGASGARAAMKEGRSRVVGFLKGVTLQSLNELKPEEADYIMRAMKKGAGVGMGMMLLGYMRPQNFGGYYQPGEKRSEADAQAGEVVVFGVHLPRWATHIPLLEAAQLGAQLRRTSDAINAKGKEGALAEGVIAAGKGLVDEIPFVKEPQEIIRDVEAGRKGVVRFAGQQARSLVPGIVQDVAGRTDRDATGKTTKRYPQGFVDEFKLGIPWWRKSVADVKPSRSSESSSSKPVVGTRQR